ncbi:MAG: DUF1565 domain-containing protein [Planctomycetes bacterium]|nr:DUF1565 domain-containing protein [Planctomycetota bacterium]
MSIRLALLVELALATAFAAAPVHAADWFVDAVNGNNVNSGTAPSDAWRTITWAVDHTPPSGVQAIHVAPGTYDRPLGETFPLRARPSMQIVGTDGSSATVVDGGGLNSTLIQVYAKAGATFGPDTIVQGLALRNATRGLLVASDLGACKPSIVDVTIEKMSVNGVEIVAGANLFPSDAGGTFSHVTVRMCPIGVAISATGSVTPTYWGSASPSFSDSAIVSNTSEGLICHAGSIGGVTLTAQRCRFADNGQSGVRASYAPGSGFVSQVDARFEDCLIVRNGADGFNGVAALATSSGGILHSTFERCTVADNGGVGMRAQTNNATQDHTMALSGCVLFGNGDDVLQNGTTTASFCDIGDGDFNGANGNFSADPLFVDAPNGDFRVKWGSPCIETGDPATPAGTLDLARNARPIDGNLDTLEQLDVGCFEFAPLFMVASGKLGTTLELQLWGPQGNATTVYFTRKPLVAPQATPFGELDLNPAFVGVYRVTTVGSGPPKKIVRPIPSSPAFAGQVFSFQALTTSAAAPQGKAYTNAVELKLVQ